MAGDGEQIDVLEFAGEIERKFCGGLDGVGVDESAVRFGDACDLADRLNGAGFVVGQHHADELRVGPQSGFDLRRVHDTSTIGLDVGNFDAAAFERLSGEEYGVVLDLRRDEVGGLVLVEQDLKNAGEREVVALGSAGGEDDLPGTAVEQRGDSGARVLDGGACALAGLMRGAWIAVALEPERSHRLEDLGQDGRGRVGVEIDTHL